MELRKELAYTIEDMKKQGYDAVGLFPGEIREPEYKDELEQKCMDLGLQQSIVFMGRRTDVPDILKALDVLIIPSIEGFPLAAFFISIVCFSHF